MPQKHMDKHVFAEILRNIPAGTVVNLQGEGESSLQPNFWEFIDQVISNGCYPFTITNGALIKKSTLKSILTYFPQLGISLDSLDDVDHTGRYNQKAVLSKIDALVEIAGIMYVTVYITDYGQNIKPLIQYLERKSIRYIVQSLRQSLTIFRGLYIGAICTLSNQ
jgi:MoaA/NifB/PqqE/SkfB family radical SAM enzyme